MKIIEIEKSGLLCLENVNQNDLFFMARINRNRVKRENERKGERMQQIPSSTERKKVKIIVLFSVALFLRFSNGIRENRGKKQERK